MRSPSSQCTAATKISGDTEGHHSLKGMDESVVSVLEEESVVSVDESVSVLEEEPVVSVDESVGMYGTEMDLGKRGRCFLVQETLIFLSFPVRSK